MDMTLPEFLAHAIALEHEAAERYLELADMMESYRNDEVASTFRDMVRYSRLHHDAIVERALGLKLPALRSWQYRWRQPPETGGEEAFDPQLTAYQALRYARENEFRAQAFYSQVAADAGDARGFLGLGRRAWMIYRKMQLSGPNRLQPAGFIPAYALAVAEENAAGGEIVTAPTCGSCGVLPAILRHIQENIDCPAESVLRALATAGLIGNLIKEQFLENRDWPLGSALSIMLTACVLALAGLAAWAAKRGLHGTEAVS